MTEMFLGKPVGYWIELQAAIETRGDTRGGEMNNCSICGWGVAWCVDKEDKGTYWLCGRCAVDDLRDKIPQQRVLVRVARAADEYKKQATSHSKHEVLLVHRDVSFELAEALSELPEGIL